MDLGCVGYVSIELEKNQNTTSFCICLTMLVDPSLRSEFEVILNALTRFILIIESYSFKYGKVKMESLHRLGKPPRREKKKDADDMVPIDTWFCSLYISFCPNGIPLILQFLVS
ncbi:hypothetical protein VNO77_20201 [Canavalia gladiata]|uniref:Uncharacterized protein n=1 Tax=Canavalia gladiata TaxID=3824 RepID=A0AAN9QL38_CANGL